MTSDEGGGMATTAVDLEQRVRHLEDLEEIRALLMEYRRALDAKDFRAYAALFARDGVFSAGPMRATGPDAVLALVEGMVGSLLTKRAGDDFHLLANVAIDLDGDRATSTSTWAYIVRDDDTPVLAKLGRYEDELVREDGHWRFAHRRAPMEVPAT
jgi:uncharacterized protein (TIGR02246 family)